MEKIEREEDASAVVVVESNNIQLKPNWTMPSPSSMSSVVKITGEKDNSLVRIKSQKKKSTRNQEKG